MLGMDCVPEGNKRLLLEFRRYLEARYADEALVDACMADASLYALDYTAECLYGSDIAEINAFDVYCFLADYMICHQADCCEETIARGLESLSGLVAFLEDRDIIDVEDMYEILRLCQDPKPYLSRWREYRKLAAARDIEGLQRWRDSALENFGT